MSPRRLLVLLLLCASTTACTFPRPGVGTAGPESVAPAAPPDPRESNAWFAAGRQAVARSARFVAGERPARNLILFVGDGMGIATVTAARILEGQRRGESGEGNLLAFETLPHVALSRTYNTDAQVSDSASTITAIVSGVKTQTGVLGVDERIRRGDHTSVDAARVVLVGHSVGAGASLFAASRDPEVAAVVALAPMADPVGWMRISQLSNMPSPRMSQFFTGPAPTISVKCVSPMPMSLRVLPALKSSILCACSLRRPS